MFFRVLVLLIFLVVSFVSFIDQPHANVASFQLTWTDNSTNEDGFIIERKTGTSGIFARIASVGANVTFYTDAGLADATTYCYRVNAFTSAGNSPYAPEVCGTTAAATTPPPPAQQFALTLGLVKTVTSSGTGNGTVTSSPSGINCGGTCSAPFSSGTLVTLTATPAVGSTFGGWSGTGCSSGVVTMDVAAGTSMSTGTASWTVVKSANARSSTRSASYQSWATGTGLAHKRSESSCPEGDHGTSIATATANGMVARRINASAILALKAICRLSEIGTAPDP